LLLLLYNIVIPPIDSSSSFIQQRHQRTTALFFQPNPASVELQEQIDTRNTTELCARYNFALDSKARRRRIYFEALAAVESRESLDLHASEVYGLYHAVALLESDRTFQGMPRQTRFQPGSDL
jgi:hypothetical protein